MDGMSSYTTDLLNIQIRNWLSIGASCLVFYDWLICLEQEELYIWSTRLSAGGVLYYIHRYPLMIVSVVSIHYSITSSVPIHECKVYVPFDLYSDLLVISSVQVTLSLRVYALYEKNKQIMFWLSLLYVICIGISFSILGTLLHRFTYYDSVRPIPGCLINCTNCEMWTPIIHVPLLLLDTVIFALTVAKCRKYLNRDHLHLPTLNTVFRDGFIYYAVILIMILFNILFLVFAHPSMGSWFLPFMRAIVGIMGTRLLLNLRGQIEERKDEAGLYLNTLEPGFQMNPLTPPIPSNEAMEPLERDYATMASPWSPTSPNSKYPLLPPPGEGIRPSVSDRMVPVETNDDYGTITDATYHRRTAL